MQEGVREMVAMTEPIDGFWRETNAPEIWERYIGTYNGVLRMYPGKVLPEEYDHQERGWWVDRTDGVRQTLE